MWQRIFSYNCVKVALPTALLLGTVYFAINHGIALATGQFNKARALAGVMQYIIPYCVCAYGYGRGKDV